MPTKPKACALPEVAPFTGVDGKPAEFPVIDAPEGLDIYVSPQDIREATRKDAGCCALAKAFQRAFGAISMKVMSSRCEILMPSDDGSIKEWSRFTFSERTRKFIADFDAGTPVQPGRYKMQAPRPSERLNNENKAKRSKKAAARKKAGTSTPNRKHKRKTYVPSTRSFTGKNAHAWKSGKNVAARKAKKVSPKK